MAKNGGSFAVLEAWRRLAFARPRRHGKGLHAPNVEPGRSGSHAGKQRTFRPQYTNPLRSVACLKIGSHVSFSNKGLLNPAQEAVGYGATSFMVYTGAPQNTRRKPMEQQFVPEGLELMQANSIDEIVVHAPYIINLASYKPDVFELAVEFLQSEIMRTDFLGQA